MTWWDTHAAGIQAVASVASLMVAVVLAGLTGWYVRLTRELAVVARSQMQLVINANAAARRQNAVSIIALASRLRDPIAELPAESPSHERLFHYSKLTEDDIRDLEALSRGIDADATKLASEAAGPLHELVGFARHARTIPIPTGWHVTEREQKRWYAAHQASLRRLDALIDHSRGVAT